MVISSDPNFLAVKKVAVTPSAIFADAEEAVHKLPGVEVHRLVQGIQKIYNYKILISAKKPKKSKRRRKIN